MLDGRVLIDAHVHVPVLGSLRPAWIEWARDFGPPGILEELWDADGRPKPQALDEVFEEQGVDAALLFCEYSPKATGYQAFEDLLPIVEHNPARFRPVANVNPHLHHPIADEVRRQLDLGAAALKLHRRVSPLLLRGVDPSFQHGLLELEEVELHRVARARLALGLHLEIGHQRDQLLVLARQPRQGILEVAQ